MVAVDHDRLFKELITTFFLDFVTLFLPEIRAALDSDFTIVPMDKEVFTDVTLGEKHEVDVLMKAKLLMLRRCCHGLEIRGSKVPTVEATEDKSRRRKISRGDGR